MTRSHPCRLRSRDIKTKEIISINSSSGNELDLLEVQKESQRGWNTVMRE